MHRPDVSSRKSFIVTGAVPALQNVAVLITLTKSGHQTPVFDRCLSYHLSKMQLDSEITLENVVNFLACHACVAFLLQPSTTIVDAAVVMLR